MGPVSIQLHRADMLIALFHASVTTCASCPLPAANPTSPSHSPSSHQMLSDKTKLL